MYIYHSDLMTPGDSLSPHETTDNLDHAAFFLAIFELQHLHFVLERMVGLTRWWHPRNYGVTRWDLRP